MNTATQGACGYVPVGTERLDPSAATVELKEALNLRFPLPFTDGSVFNREQLQIITEFRKHIDRVSKHLLCILSEICGVSADYFVSRHQSSEANGSTLRFLHYLPLKSSNNEEKIRAGRHSDYGSLTFLFQQSVGGLQVMDPKSYSDLAKDGSFDNITYLNVPVTPGTIIVNVGDLLQIWTGGFLHSAQHRVICRENGAERYSIAYFLHPNDNAVVEQLKVKLDSDIHKKERVDWEDRRMKGLTHGLEEGFTAQRYLQHRLRKSYNRP